MNQHLIDEQINDLADSRLSPEAAQWVSGHLDTCDECRVRASNIASVLALAGELRQPIEPARDLWPEVSRRTVHGRWIRGPWLFTLIFSVLVISATSVWLERTRPWERIATQIVSEPEYRASDVEISRLLQALNGPMGDATTRSELDRLAPAVFRSSNPAIRAEFFQSVQKIQSDGEKRRLLLLLMRHAADVSLAPGFIQAARSIGSSSSKAEVLAAIAGAPSMTEPSLRLLYLDAVETISSERDRSHARSALLSR